MKNQTILKWIVIIIIVSALVVLSLILAPMLKGFFQRNSAEAQVGYSSETVRAKVLKIQENGTTIVGKAEQEFQVVETEIMEGQYAGSFVILEFGKYQTMPKEYYLEPGDEILVTVGVSPIDNSQEAYFIDFIRDRAILVIFLVFTLVAFVVGGWTGLRSLVGILVGIGIIVGFIVPQITKGADPILTSIIGSSIFLAVSLYVVYGWKKMTHAAVLSMVLALIVTGTISTIAVRSTRLTGFGNEDMMFLVQQSDQVINMRGILLAGIIIGSLGVLDDLVVGQSSAVFQLVGVSPDLSFKEVFHRAMVIGRDHVAASVNTLVLAYAGESLPMLLLFSITNVNLGMAINVGYIAEEIVRALAGTIGLFCSIPIATAMAALWAKQSDKISEVT